MSNSSVFTIPHRLAFQFLRFTGVGAVATLTHYTVLVGLVNGLHLAPTLASALGFGVGAVVNYGLNYRFTFASNKQHAEAFTKFLIVALIGLTLNSVTIAIAIGLGLHYLFAQFLATGLVLELFLPLSLDVSHLRSTWRVRGLSVVSLNLLELFGCNRLSAPVNA